MYSTSLVAALAVILSALQDNCAITDCLRATARKDGCNVNVIAVGDVTALEAPEIGRVGGARGLSGLVMQTPEVVEMSGPNKMTQELEDWRWRCSKMARLLWKWVRSLTEIFDQVKRTVHVRWLCQQEETNPNHAAVVC